MMPCVCNRRRGDGTKRRRARLSFPPTMLHQWILSRSWLVLLGGAGLFLCSRLLADRASRRVATARRQLQRADAAVFGRLQETLAASEDLRLWGAREQAVAEFADTAHGVAAARREFAAALAVAGQIKRVFSSLSPLLVIVALQLGGQQVGAGERLKVEGHRGGAAEAPHA